MPTPAKKGSPSNGRRKAGAQRKLAPMHVPKQKPRKPTPKQLAAGRRLLAELDRGRRPITQADIESVYREWDEAESR